MTEITKGSAWRATEDVELPSGKVARLQKPDVLALIMSSGEIPDVLSGQLLAGLQGGAAPKEPAEITADSLSDLLEVVNTVTKAAFVLPRIVDKPADQMDEDEIGIEHVAFNDRVFVLKWAMGDSIAAASRFPDGAARVGTVPAGGNVRKSAKRPARRQ